MTKKQLAIAAGAIALGAAATILLIQKARQIQLAAAVEDETDDDAGTWTTPGGAVVHGGPLRS